MDQESTRRIHRVPRSKNNCNNFMASVMEDWKGTLLLQDGKEIQDIRLSTIASKPRIPISDLQFLSYVDVSQVPLHLICGPKVDVWTTSPETESWFSSLLFSSAANSEQEWWHSARLESQLGILAAVQSVDENIQPRVTEILFYVSRKDTSISPPTPPHGSQQDTQEPEYHIYALPLSSDLLPSNITATTPPHSPSLTATQSDTPHGRFLPRPWEPTTSTYAKRKHALETTFSAASEARKRAKRHLGESVAAAAASNTPQPVLPTLASTRRSSLDTRTQVPLLTRPASRSPSISSLRREPLEHKRSSLARVTAAPTTVPSSTTTSTSTAEATLQKNKDTISKIVMAGMRVWGLSQFKRSKRKSKDSVNTSQNPEQAQPELDAQNDETYKQIYQHVYKAAQFSFRGVISTTDLSPHALAIRDTVDTLLLLFCRDPLVDTEAEAEKVMSAGPKGAIVRTPLEEDRRLGFG